MGPTSARVALVVGPAHVICDAQFCELVWTLDPFFDFVVYHLAELGCKARSFNHLAGQLMAVSARFGCGAAR